MRWEHGCRHEGISVRHADGCGTNDVRNVGCARSVAPNWNAAGCCHQRLSGDVDATRTAPPKHKLEAAAVRRSIERAGRTVVRIRAREPATDSARSLDFDRIAYTTDNGGKGRMAVEVSDRAGQWASLRRRRTKRPSQSQPSQATSPTPRARRCSGIRGSRPGRAHLAPARGGRLPRDLTTRPPHRLNQIASATESPLTKRRNARGFGPEEE